ncbi:MAG: hypothetical protein SF051_11980 [Elusimicrobiota bacterium]|nr:hypothetical protein [Elusimicrobiota bacterium]
MLHRKKLVVLALFIAAIAVGVHQYNRLKAELDEQESFRPWNNQGLTSNSTQAADPPPLPKPEDPERLKKIAEWTPPDRIPFRFLVAGNQAAAIFHYRIEFYDDPRAKDFKKVAGVYARHEWQVPKIEIAPKKTLTFKQRFEFLPTNGDPKERIFVCTDILHNSYGAQTDEERDMVAAKGYPQFGFIPWVNQTGEIDQFCGLISLAGDIVFKFPLIQEAPGFLATHLGLSPDETEAAIVIGEKVTTDSDEPDNLVGNPREVWLWQFPGKIKKISTKEIGTTDMEELRRRYYQGRIRFAEIRP